MPYLIAHGPFMSFCRFPLSLLGRYSALVWLWGARSAVFVWGRSIHNNGKKGEARCAILWLKQFSFTVLLFMKQGVKEGAFGYVVLSAGRLVS